MPRSNEILPGLLAAKAIAACHQIREVIDGVAQFVTEVGLRQCAIREYNAHHITGDESGYWMAELEWAYREMVPVYASVQGMFLVRDPQFAAVLGNEQEIQLRNILIDARNTVDSINRLFVVMGSSASLFEYIVNNCSLLDPVAHQEAETVLSEAINIGRLIQAFAGHLQFHLEVIANICNEGMLVPPLHQD